MKKCSKCKLEKAVDCFNKRGTDSTSLQSMCKECAASVRKERYLSNKDIEKNRSYSNRIKRVYGITDFDYQKMFDNQNGKCAICGSLETGRGKTNKFCIDHDHKTGKVRGLLCRNCNVLLGKLSDSIGLCQNIITYLKSF